LVKHDSESDGSDKQHVRILMYDIWEVDNDDDEDLNQAASGALFAESCDQAPKRQKVFFATIKQL
jgi:hypothetical protein